MSRTITNKTPYDIYAYNGTIDRKSTDNTIKFIIKPGQTVTWTDTSGTGVFFIGVQYTYPGNFIYKKAGDSGTIQQLTLGVEVRLRDEEADTYTLKTISYESYGATSTTPITFYDNPDGSGGGGTSGGGTTIKTKTIEYTLDSHTTATPESFKEGDTVTITLTADDGYSIKTAEGNRFNYDTEKDESIPFTISTDKKTATATVVDTSDYGMYEVTGDSDDGTTTITKTIKYTLDSHTTATPESFKEGDTVTITLTADDGYSIKTAEGNRFNYDTEKDESIPFTISTDKKTATATVVDTFDYGVYEVTGDSDAAPSPTTLDGLTSIYLPTDEELGEIGKLRYSVTISPSSSVVVDLGAYIVNYIKMFIDVTPTGKTDCVLGYFNTQIEVNYTNNQIQEIDCGSITVNEINKNVTDYTDVESKIFLPFIGMIDIDSKKIMGKTINLKYRINLINGDCVALLYSDSVLISVSHGQIGYKMPYILNDNLLTAVENYSFNGQYLLDKKPYLLIYYKNQISNSTNYNGNAWYTIKDLNGYTIFTDVVITGLDCTIDELAEIEQILKSGVIL
jgi:hypothetical protein